MTSINDEVRISAPARRVYEALSRQAGYRGWWNTVAQVAEAVGGDAQLRFDKGGTPVNMRFRIDEKSSNERVQWTLRSPRPPELGWYDADMAAQGCWRRSGSRVEAFHGQPQGVCRDWNGPAMVTRARVN